MNEELLELRDLALHIAREVAAIPADAQPRVHDARTVATSTKSTPLDLVTELDEATERAIVQRIAAARPADGVLAEEGGAAPSSSGYTWVIDPIDGTVNYFFGHASWAISLGIRDASGQDVVGVVHAPALGETVVAARGHGAHLVVGETWTRLTPPPDTDLGEALLATGFSYDPQKRIIMATVLAELLPRIRDVRRIGAASLDIVAVALGRISGYYERDLKPWDLSAASVIAREVGLTVTGKHGAAAGNELTIVAPPGLARVLHDEIVRLWP